MTNTIQTASEAQVIGIRALNDDCEFVQLVKVRTTGGGVVDGVPVLVDMEACADMNDPARIAGVMVVSEGSSLNINGHIIDVPYLDAWDED